MIIVPVIIDTMSVDAVAHALVVLLVVVVLLLLLMWAILL
jgi:hypothetical protein